MSRPSIKFGFCGSRPVVTKSAGKFQITVPIEIRTLFGLEEGDLFEWHFDRNSEQLTLIPKRAQLITPRAQQYLNQVRARNASVSPQPKPALSVETTR